MKIPDLPTLAAVRIMFRRDRDFLRLWIVGCLVFASPGFGVFPFAQPPPIILESPNAQDEGQFGNSVAWVPDVNGDGQADIIVGAWMEEPGGSPVDAGRVYLFDGVTRQLQRELKSPGQVANSLFGSTVAGTADLDGDGRGDVIVSTDTAEAAVYVFSGATGTVLHRLATRGRSISAVPDVNGDGRPEILTGYYDPQAAILWDGASGRRLRTFTSPNRQSDGFFGLSVSGVPDLNGDGRGDVIVGALLENLPRSAEQPEALPDAGRAYVFDGATGSLLHTLIAPEAQVNGQFGRSVAGLADANGDGYADLAVGQNNAERVYIFNGYTGALLHTLNDPEPDETRLFGWNLNGLSDINGDGRGDVVVSSFPPFGTSDSAFVFSGVTGELLRTLPGHSGESGGARGVSGLPDVNGDGNGEVLVVDPYAESTTGFYHAGRVLLYLSESTPNAPQPSAIGWSSEGFMLRLIGKIDTRYELQSSEDLKNWSTEVTQVHANEMTEFLDPSAKNASQRFYRTRIAR